MVADKNLSTIGKIFRGMNYPFTLGTSIGFCMLGLVKWKIKIISGGPIDNLQGVLEWDGTSWTSLTNELCTSREYHTTVVYGGEIYHMGLLETSVSFGRLENRQTPNKNMCHMIYLVATF